MDVVLFIIMKVVVVVNVREVVRKVCEEVRVGKKRSKKEVILLGKLIFV